jgi:predicted dehydrogenase
MRATLVSRSEAPSSADALSRTRTLPPSRAPRLGFLGLGWIGHHRMQAILADGAGEIAAIADPAPDVAARAHEVAPGAALARSLEALLELDLDGVVIATPSGLHAEQARSALETGVAVFCQKPLARTAAETSSVIAVARRADRLLGVDLSYRYTEAMQRVRELVKVGELGDIYAVDLVFHNAYGPDKAWYRDPALSGGGCVIDLGIHLVDLALWTLDFPNISSVSSRLYAQGHRLSPQQRAVEDYAVAQLDLENGAVVRLTCSWNLPAGRDAVIEASFHGTRAGVSFRNVNGSFYDFVAERFDGTRCGVLATPPDAWGGRAAVAWTRQLASDERFDSEIEHAIDVAAVLDAVYGR